MPPRRVAAGLVVMILAAATLVGAGGSRASAATPPSAPSGLGVSVGHSGWAELSWQRPASTGGSKILYYVYRTSPTDPGDAIPQFANYGDHLGAQVVADYGVTYRFSIAAVNAVGQGPWSDAAPPVVPRPVVSVANASTPEGDSGAHNLTFTIRLDFRSTQPVSVAYKTSKPRLPADYLPVSGTLTFAPGQTVKTVAVPIVGDTRVEPNEKLRFRLFGISGAVFGKRSAIGTIVNDD